MAHQEKQREAQPGGVPASLFTRRGTARYQKWTPPVDAPFAAGGDIHIEVPLHVAMAGYLTHGAKLLYGLIRFCAHGKAWANPSLATLSRGTRLAQSGVQKAIKALSACGYIRPVKTDQDRIDLKAAMHNYYDDYRKEPGGYNRELERLGLTRPREDNELGANIYLLAWNKYWDLAWKWHAGAWKTENERRTLMDYVRHGLPEHRKARKPRGTGMVQPVQSSTQGVAPAPAPRPAEESSVPVEQGSTIVSSSDIEAVEAFAIKRIKDLTGFDKLITPEEHTAIEQALPRVDKKGRPLDVRQLRVLIGWYLKSKARQIRRALGDFPPATYPKFYNKHLSLVEACSERTEDECRTALESLLYRTMRISRKDMTEEELAQKRLKYFRDGVNRAGMDALDVPLALHVYIKSGKERHRRA